MKPVCINSQMNNFVTISDKDYALKAITLYESLKSTQIQEFTLYLVCLDDETYTMVNNISEKSQMP